MRSRPPLVLTTLVVGAAWLGPLRAHAQDLGHRIPGTLGLTAGNEPEQGLYAADRFVVYGANRARDRDGNVLPLQGFDQDVLTNAVGVSGTVKLPRAGPYLTASLSAPLSSVTLSIDLPQTSLDRFGLGDIYVQPVRVGWRLPHLDVVAGYAFYAPTNRFEPGQHRGVGSGQWTQEFSLGGTVFFDHERSVFVSALASYHLNQPKLGVDITRGDTVQIQGGAGVRLFRLINVGVVGYALWQVRDDRGADVPQVLRGARDQVYGLGPEVGALLPFMNSTVSVRYEHDFAVRSRPEGQLLVFSLTWAMWRPPRRQAPRSVATSGR